MSLAHACWAKNVFLLFIRWVHKVKIYYLLGRWQPVTIIIIYWCHHNLLFIGATYLLGGCQPVTIITYLLGGRQPVTIIYYLLVQRIY